MSERLWLVDIGNSRLKWARSESGRLTPGAAFASKCSALTAHLERHWSSVGCPDAVYVSNVAGSEIARRLEEWVSARWGSPVIFARSEPQRDGVVNGYVQPECLGVDRWLGLLALHRDYALPACLVDCGTAITLDLLDAAGRHQGGLIAPGLATMKGALLAGANGIAMEATAGHTGLLGRNTVACVESGVRLACAGLIEKAVRELSTQSDRHVLVVLTGGDAAAIAHHLALPWHLDEHIVLRGLLTIAESES